MNSNDPYQSKLLNISTLTHKLQHIQYIDLLKMIEDKEKHIFCAYHKLYPSILYNTNKLNSITKKQNKDLKSWVRQLFKNEIELKVQIILSTNYWKTNYILHKKLNDQLLHDNHYKNTNNNNNNNNNYITPKNVIEFICKYTNGMEYIERVYRQLNYLGQQCTDPNMNLKDKQNETVQKIDEFLDRHEFEAFRVEILKCFQVAIAQEEVLTDNIEIEYKLRQVIDVKNGNDWRSGTIIKIYNDGSIKVALHYDELDENGEYKYDSHCRIRNINLSLVIHCIDENGEYEMDNNIKLLISNSNSNSNKNENTDENTNKRSRERNHEKEHSNSISNPPIAKRRKITTEINSIKDEKMSK